MYRLNCTLAPRDPAPHALPAIGRLKPSAVDDIDEVDEKYDDHFADLPRNAGHNVGEEEVAAPERLLALHES